MLLRGLARRHRLVRILVFELVERKAMRSAKRIVSAIASGQIAKQPRHFVRRLQMALGIGFEPPADGVDRRLFADAGEHILQRTARGMVIQHLVGREQRHAGGGRQPMQPRQAALVVAAIEQACREPDAIGAALLQAVQDFMRLRRLKAMRQRQHQKLSFGEFQQVVEPQMAFALFVRVVAALAAGEQLAEPAVGCAIARIDQNVRRAVDEDETRSDQQLRLVWTSGFSSSL